MRGPLIYEYTNATELCALNGHVGWYGDYISMKLLEGRLGGLVG